MSLLCLRSTPVDSQLLPPAELLYQRKLQSNLPIGVGNQIPDKGKINQRLTERQQRMKYYHDRIATDLIPLTAGQYVRMQDQATKKWHPGTISCKRPEPRSYEVKTQSGSVLFRNRRHLCPAGTEVIVTDPIERACNCGVWWTLKWRTPECSRAYRDIAHLGAQPFTRYRCQSRNPKWQSELGNIPDQEWTYSY